MSPINPAPDAPPFRPALRLWPGVVLVTLQWLFRFGVPLVAPDAVPIAVLGAVGCGLGVIIWWLLFSRAPWADRVGAIVLIIAAVIATRQFVHPSIAGGMMGMMLPVIAIPFLCLALVVSAAASRHLSRGRRRGSMAAAILVACGVFLLLRTGGISGSGGSDLHWRWTPTPEERLLAQTQSPLAPPARPLDRVAPVAPKSTTEWPGFRGPNRDSVVRGVRIETDWSKSLPVELWRRAVGPGWSSFAVRGDFFYTQEQLGENEVVSCYKVSSGEPVWQHRDPVRFWESNAGAGPRATPSLGRDRVYAFGATGILNALNASDGTVVWSRNVATERHTNVPTWGFASSPLLIDDLVVVAVPGKLAAYDAVTGLPRWFGAPQGVGYSSPHQAIIDGVPQILLLSTGGVAGVAPASGKMLWTHEWKGDGIVQPALTPEGDILIGSGSGLGGSIGTRRLGVTHATDKWSVEERWTSRGLKPYYNDLVVHKGHAFGFDGSNLACIDLKDGERKWKGGRYGNGQLLLLADQDLLLVISEKGELALVSAATDEFKELARLPAIKGKTWNHPVLAGDVLLVRNDEEMAAFRLVLKTS